LNEALDRGIGNGLGCGDAGALPMHHSLEKNPRLTPLRIGLRLKLLVEIFIELCPSYANVTVSTVFSGY
jgi:hypothetical protein